MTVADASVVASPPRSSISAIDCDDTVSPHPYPPHKVHPITADDVHTHAYALAGTYTVTLTEADDDGGTATVSFIVDAA